MGPPGSAAEPLVVLTPGVGRFGRFRPLPAASGRFRSLGRVQHGPEPFDGLRPEQDRYGVYFP